MRNFANFRSVFFPFSISFTHETKVFVGNFEVLPSVLSCFTTTRIAVVTLTTEALRIGSGPCRLLW